jgi:hypothetical protein
VKLVDRPRFDSCMTTSPLRFNGILQFQEKEEEEEEEKI